MSERTKRRRSRLTAAGSALTPAPRRLASAPRDSSSARLYGHDWRKARAAFLVRHPLCEWTGEHAPGCRRVAEVVDHIVPHRGDERLFWDRSNWQALSRACHDGPKQRQDVERYGAAADGYPAPGG